MLSSLCIWAGPQFAPRGCSSQRTCCSSWRLTIHIVHLKQPQDKKTNDFWDLEKCLQRCQSHSGVYRLVFDLGRCKNSVSAITLTFMLIGNPQSLIRIQREQRQQQRDFKESDFKLLPWKVCLFKEKLLCRIYSSHYFGHLWGWKPFKTKENISSFPTHSYYHGTVSLWRTTCRSWAWMTVYLKASQVQ